MQQEEMRNAATGNAAINFAECSNLKWKMQQKIMRNAA